MKVKDLSKFGSSKEKKIRVLIFSRENRKENLNVAHIVLRAVQFVQTLTWPTQAGYCLIRIPIALSSLSTRLHGRHKPVTVSLG
jgi:hypothetical protein